MVNAPPFTPSPQLRLSYVYPVQFYKYFILLSIFSSHLPHSADKPVHVLYDVPKDARVVNGSCAADSQFLLLTWNAISLAQNTLKVSFAYNKTEHEFALAGLNFFLNVYGEQFPNAKGECLQNYES